MQYNKFSFQKKNVTIFLFFIDFSPYHIEISKLLSHGFFWLITHPKIYVKLLTNIYDQTIKG